MFTSACYVTRIYRAGFAVVADGGIQIGLAAFLRHTHVSRARIAVVATQFLFPRRAIAHIATVANGARIRIIAGVCGVIVTASCFCGAFIDGAGVAVVARRPIALARAVFLAEIPARATVAVIASPCGRSAPRHRYIFGSAKFARIVRFGGALRDAFAIDRAKTRGGFVAATRRRDAGIVGTSEVVIAICRLSFAGAIGGAHIGARAFVGVVARFT